MKTIEKTIQQSERYEAPRVKVRVLRKRASLMVTISGQDGYNPGGGIEGETAEEGL